MIILYLCALTLFLLFATLTIRGNKLIADDIWVKVSFRLNNHIRTGWCRVIPGVGVKFYTLDGEQINHKVSVVDHFFDGSSPPTPKENSDFFLGKADSTYPGLGP